MRVYNAEIDGKSKPLTECEPQEIVACLSTDDVSQLTETRVTDWDEQARIILSLKSRGLL